MAYSPLVRLGFGERDNFVVFGTNVSPGRVRSAEAPGYRPNAYTSFIDIEEGQFRLYHLTRADYERCLAVEKAWKRNTSPWD